MKDRVAVVACIAALVGVSAASQEYLPDKAGVVSAVDTKPFSPYTLDFPAMILWGDTHPHTAVHEAKRFGIGISPDAPITTQERAYTSPISYTP